MIRQAQPCEAVLTAKLALQLWPDNELCDLTAEFSALLNSPDCAVFIDFSGETPVGFAQCQLRRDYVEGTGTSPVGYLEGIFVRPDFRGQGRARALLTACEAWAASVGCTEFASDCKLDNDVSLQFHLKMGFIEANRIICFTKELHK